ncbi:MULTISPECIES: lmo0937 family membrane protein [Bacillaceae]|uniref:ABC-type iron transport system FetAB permease component n=1 Tax=Priestia iocasae TaxID=2291674 RepID=A0ABS2QYJ1_9BACI|nr:MULTISPECIES: lmo0937 family membrane protein [Bacillaceae]MBM7704047.1 ABC-type iron transport system FetAB permease component [Metabacillus iocasae]
MLWTIIGVLLLAWLLGVVFDVGSLIHALLVIALIVLVVKLIKRA